MKKIWMKVTSDRYEFPLIMADSIEELAKKSGKTKNAVRSAIAHAKKRGTNCRYQCVEVEDDEEGII